ncbi:MAG: ribosome small subunit-dependent GTPase A [Oscillospiraceae bacterium]|jgi:ribosome biogenesis GTPase|nr:ribosome small subunit-dependent GTPase A [Oscillospiraceae bacterium]
MCVRRGRIVLSVGGLYTVKTFDGEIITCRARGLFRLKNISPCAGDFATVSFENAEGVIRDIDERRNELVRPPLANLDAAVIVVSSCEPNPNALILDKLTVILESKKIETAFAFTKIDKKEAALFDVYQKAGFSCFSVDNETGAGANKLADFLIARAADARDDAFFALIGNTGAGKTSLLNRLIPDLNRPTAEISKKLGRGRHTTRTVELHDFRGGGYIADTPGFSSVRTGFYGDIKPGETAECFREFSPFSGRCEYAGCAHTGESGCAVGLAAEKGVIAPGRYENYKRIYEEIKEEHGRARSAKR